MRMDRRAGLLAFARAVPISYTGSYTEELVTMDGAQYRLFTLTSSGTLSADAQVTGDIWICGGGGTGESWGGNGGGGGYAATSTGASFQNLVVTIGAGGVYPGYSSTESRGVDGNSTSISGDVSLSANGGKSGNKVSGYYGNGGSGGGTGGNNRSAGTGDGIAKTPFGSSYFSYPYCDGGGGGGYKKSSTSNTKGGNGGTNGGNGGANASGSNAGGAGGGHYGGAGGAYNAAGSAATGYGSGGGGGGRNVGNTANAGNGYQGVCFIRIPA